MSNSRLSGEPGGLSTRGSGIANRRRLLAAGVLAPLLRRTGSTPVARAQAMQSGGNMFRGNAAKTGEMPGPGVDRPPTVRWRRDAPRGEWLAPAVMGGQVFVSRYLGGLAAFDAGTGDPLWGVLAGEYDKFDSSPAVADGLVVTGAGPYSMLAVDAATGTTRWTFKAEVDLSALPAGARDYAETLYGTFFSSPTIADGTVYVGAWSATGDGTIGENPANGIYALELETGRLLWHVPVAYGAISSPAVVAGVVYVVDRKATLYAIEAAIGRERWSVSVSGTATSSPAVVQDTVYVTIRGQAQSPGGGVFAFSAGTGVPIWRQAVVEPSSPAVSGGVVYVGTRDGTLTAFDARDGSTRWSIQVDGAVAAPTVVPGGSVYVGTTGGHVYAIDAASGAERWKFSGERAFLSSPTVVDGLAIVGDEGGTLFALG